MNIGGIDASLWIGRRVRLNDKRRSAGHCMRGTLLDILANGKALVKPDGHRRGDVMSVDDVVPWWSQNPDLHQRRFDAKPALGNGLPTADSD